VGEGKGTQRKESPLSQSRLTTTVGGHGYTQPSRLWLAAPREPGNDYLTLLENSPNLNHQRAADLLEDAIEQRRRYIAMIVHLHPALTIRACMDRG
jgi:hypothetical protein